MSLKFIVRFKGSSKSGNYGHGGRPGKVGGSMPKGTGVVGGAIVASNVVERDFKGWPVVKQNSARLSDAERTAFQEAVDRIDKRMKDPALVARMVGPDKKFLTEKRSNLQQALKRDADSAKADYIKAHPESVAAHQAAGKPIKPATASAPPPLPAPTPKTGGMHLQRDANQIRADAAAAKTPPKEFKVDAVRAHLSRQLGDKIEVMSATKFIGSRTNGLVVASNHHNAKDLAQRVEDSGYKVIRKYSNPKVVGMSPSAKPVQYYSAVLFEKP